MARDAGIERSAVLAILFLVVLTRLPTLGQPLLERHDWRQTQTAYAALIYAENGIDLLHPKVPVLGPPFDLPYEFPLYQALASIPMTAGVPPDLALRVVCLATFLVSSVLLYGLIRHIAGREVALAALVFFAFSPLAIVWSRTSMIEYTVTAGALGMVWAGISWRERPSALLWSATFAAALIAMLVKPTTGIFYLLPLLGYRTAAEGVGLRAFIRERLNPKLILLVVAPLVVAFAWTRYADSIKAANVLTAPYTSDGLARWYFGTIGDRLQIDHWIAIAKRVAGGILGISFAPVVLVALIAMLHTSQRLFWIALAGVAVLPFAVFVNLYAEHDYYFVAVSPAWAGLLGLGAAFLWSRVRRHGRLIAATGAAAVVSAWLLRDYVTPIYRPVADPFEVLPLAGELRAASHPDDLVLVLGHDWSPSVHYYARRSGFAVSQEFLTHHPGDPGDWHAEWSWPPWVDRAQAQAKAGRDYRIVASAHPDIDPIWLVGRWPWMGVLGQRTYAVGNAPRELRGAAVAGTDQLVAAPPGNRLIAAPLVLRCAPGVAVDVPTGARGTWITENVPSSPEARLRVSSSLAPILAKHVVAVSVAVAPPNTVLHLSCSGSDQLLLVAVTDAPPPETN